MDPLATWVIADYRVGLWFALEYCVYRVPHQFRRSPEERADQLLSWKRPDPAFFAAGACHMLVEAFLRAYPDSGYERVGLRDTPSSVVNHMLAANEHWVFDFNG